MQELVNLIPFRVKPHPLPEGVSRVPSFSFIPTPDFDQIYTVVGAMPNNVKEIFFAKDGYLLSDLIFLLIREGEYAKWWPQEFCECCEL